MAGEWMSSKRKSEEAFANDWGSYENRHGGGGGVTYRNVTSSNVNHRYQQQQQASFPIPSTANKTQPQPSKSTYVRNNNSSQYQNQHQAYRNGVLHNQQTTGNTNKSTHRVKSPYAHQKSNQTQTTLLSTFKIEKKIEPKAASSVIDRATFTSSISNPKPTVELPDDISLNKEQRLVVGSILSGYSTFFTGPAGSGKSHVLSSLLRLNEEENYAKKKRIVVTATTGVAACNIGGVTIHSFAGIGTGEGDLSNMVSRVMGNNYAKQRWRECDVLIIDEVSMMPASFLDNLNFVAKRARDDRREFGGVQVVLCGDFFQLPPVSLKNGGFAFEAKCWTKIIQSSILLKQIFRQNGDAQLTQILNEARIGELSDASISILRNHSRNQNKDNSNDTSANIKPTLLECRNRQVDGANNHELSKLTGDVYTFTSKDRAMNNAYKAQLKNCAAPEKLTLKVGAQVILLKNIDQENGLVNGSRGVVVEFRKSTKTHDLPREFKRLELPVVKFDTIEAVGNENDGEEKEQLKLIEPAEWTTKVGDAIVSSRTQIPLRLAWALSVHKSQGMTIPHLMVSLAGVFEYGQAYVALSRATKLSQLTLRGFHEKAFRAHPKVKAFYQIIQGEGGDNESASSGGAAPVVLKSSNMPQVSKVLPPRVNAVKLTQEQMRRMEENRQRALAIRRRKQEAQAATPANANERINYSTSPASVITVEIKDENQL